MLFDKNGLYLVDNYDNDYDFAVDIINGSIGSRPTKNYDLKIQNNNKTIKIYDLEEALKRGNAFPNLYDSYKNYRPMELKVNNAREKALLDIQMLDFSINDLNLYLDLHPEDRYAYQLFKNFIKECNKKKDEYSKTYGPLIIDDLTDVYEWSKGVWPWEEGMM